MALGDLPKKQTNYFTTGWRQQIHRMLPPAMRGLSFIDYLTALCEPVQTASEDIAEFEVDVRTRLKYNGQTMVLQQALNEIFAITFEPFILVQTDRTLTGLPNFFYAEAEAIPTTFFFGEAEVPPEIPPYFDSQLAGDGTKDFYVFVPINVGDPETVERIRAETQTYKIAGKIFEIIIY